MSDYSADFQRILDEELGNYAARALAELATAIQKKGLVFAEELLQSLHSEVVAASVRHVAWVGVDKFNYVPGYRYGQFPLTKVVAINRIAWDISRAKLRDNSAVRPKAWFARTFYSSLNRFIHAVTTRYAAQTGTHIAASIRI